MLPIFTDRENQIPNLIAEAYTNGEISCHHSISDSTIENHIHHIYEKRGFHTWRRSSRMFQGKVVQFHDIRESKGNPL